ncbi:MAG: hypothetical protein AAF500_14550 [Myxococcota bacterium]
MTTTKLGGLRLALIGAACWGLGCDTATKSGPPNDQIYFGRSFDSYELCFLVQEDFEALIPTTDCDRVGVTAFSFNIEVEAGTDPDGDTCSFVARFEDPIEVTTVELSDGTEERTFTARVPSQSDPGLDAVINGSLVVDQNATGEAFLTDSPPDTSDAVRLCEVMWVASPGPICRAEAFLRCQLLAECCDSMLQVPPIANDCAEVVDACNPDRCEEVLAGFPGCQQPPICTVQQDPFGFCITLNECCATEAAPPDCVQIAEMCNPAVCQDVLEENPDCEGGVAASGAP